MNYFQKDPLTAFNAKAEAQRIAFGPIVFQACRVLRDSGILDRIKSAGANGLALEEVVAKANLPRYGVKVLLEAGLGIGLFFLREGRYVLGNLGYFILRDPMTPRPDT